MKSQKHTLYKPASQGHVGSKPKRKTLAQGRLVSKPIVESANNTAEFDQSLEVRKNLSNQQLSVGPGGDDEIINIVSQPSNTAKDKTGRLLCHNGTRHGYVKENCIVDVQANRNVMQPRNDLPHLSMSESPKLARPSRVLDISDSDSEHHLNPPDVVVVDARGQTKDANISEVNISVGYERSPVKVTCHSPDKVQSNLRNTGNVEIGRRVAVDQVPTVSILADDEASEGEEPPVTRRKSPLVVRENTIAGSKIDPHSTAKPALVKTLFHSLLEEPEDVPSQRASYPRPMRVMDETIESDQSIVSLKENIDTDYGPPGYTSTDVGHAHVEKHGAIKKPPRLVTMADAGGEKKKKKPPRFVSSRYMQAGPKGPMRATDRSLVNATTSSFEASMKEFRGVRSGSVNMNNSTGTHRSTGKRTPGGKQNRQNSSLSRPSNPNTSLGRKTKSSKSSSAGSSFRLTPDVKQAHRFVSTPSSDNSAFSSPGDVDVSAIEPMPNRSHGSRLHHSFPAASPGKTGARDGLSATHMDHSAAHGPRDTVHEASKKKTDRVSQWDLELLYSRFMQFVYIESKAKRSFKAQECSGMTYLYGLWEENDKQRRKKSELEQQLAQLQHLNVLDDTLDIQKTGLSSVASGLAQANKQYPTLAEAIDTTRHQIQTRGVYIPPDDEAHSESLLQAFDESEQLLGELSVMSRQDTPKITDLSNSLDVTGKSLNQEIGELSKCAKSMKRVEKKAMHELALYSRNWSLD